MTAVRPIVRLKAQAQQLVQAVAVFKLVAGTAVDAVRPAVDSATPVSGARAPHATERRGPARATNVSRPAFATAKAKPAQEAQPVAFDAPGPNAAAQRTGTDSWESF
jgi:hypothetical protein